jgi:hypothetical protein
MIMRRSLWIVPALLLLAISTRNAPARLSTFAISFTGDGAPTVVGSNLISYSFTAQAFTSPASLVLLYQGNYYILPLVTPHTQAMSLNGIPHSPDPDADNFGWGASLLSDGRMEIYMVDLVGPSKIFIYHGGPLPTKPGGSGTVVLTPGNP